MATPASFKKSLLALLQMHIDDAKPLPIEWRCEFCNVTHSGNLIKKASSISYDNSFEDLKPDATLISEDQSVLAVIHISANKKPVDKAKIYYGQHNIIFIQVRPGDDTLASITKPLYVGTCLNPRCKKCGGFQQEKSLVIIDSECWNCKGQMKVAVLDCGGGHYPGPDAFSEEELALARNKGVDIRSNYSKTVGHSYLSNTCPACEKLTGNHFLFTDHFTAAIYGYLTFERIPQGYYCESCDMENGGW